MMTLRAMPKRLFKWLGRACNALLVKYKSQHQANLTDYDETAMH